MEIKKDQTPLIFDKIYESYDQMNHIISLGLDKRWRKKFVKLLKNRDYDVVIDLASGTGDLLVELAALNAKHYYAIDPSVKMLTLAETKFYCADFINASAESMPFNNNSVDLITISFGIRNFPDMKKAFDEMYRILNNNGIVSIMEFSIPEFFLFRWGFLIYLKAIIPLLVTIFRKNKQAYKYLQESILDFGRNIKVTELLEESGFIITKKKKLTLGVVSIYSCKKINNN
ncbi:MAG: ubiquinone/menaquinone biosynthesis methyltransferase [Bacteroidales bacterium]|jgi:demethylmenaquinone methyltransferase/2-methoxy-6-polyprenyl-1,4-benzoquinol methylase|nr:ubiquinone/menaquinone biosynthesis methyltransferase [Bacteroidales bacterium]